MDQNRTSGNEKSCSTCNQKFQTENELQEHQRSAHGQDRNKQPGSEPFDQPGQGEKRERVA